MNKKIIPLLILTFLLTNFVTADTFVVPSSSYPTIESAISIAITGDEIFVNDGIYTPPAPDGYDLGGKDIQLKSINGPQNCIIDCGNNGRAFYFHSRELPTTLVDGFTIRNGSAYYGGAIECEIDSSPAINNCILTNNSATFGGAIDCFYSSPVITNCVIKNNTSDADGGAIEIACESSPQITNCLIVNNTANGNGAIDCYDNSSPQIINCTIADNVGSAGHGGVHNSDIGNPVIRNSILWNNGDDLYNATAGYSCVEDNDSNNPLFKTGPLGDYYLSQISAGQLANSECIETGGDLAEAIFGVGHTFTTRTDNVPDVGTVNIGFHYPDSGADVECVLVTAAEPNENFGTIDPNFSAPGQTYKQFSEVLLNANPASNCNIDKWTIDGNDINSTDANYIVTMDANHTVKVWFTPVVCSLTTLVVSGNGTIEPNWPSGNSFPTNTQISVNAYPIDPNFYGVNRWLKGTTGIFNLSDPGTYSVIYGPGTTHTVTLNADTTLAVEFARFLLNTDVVNDIGGSLDPKRTFQPARKTVTLTATPDYGYIIKKWTGTDNDSSTALTNTVIMTANKNVTVEFQAIPQYQLTVNVANPAGGSVTPAPGSYMFTQQTAVTLTAQPISGYRVLGWTEDGVPVPETWNVNTYTVTMTSNKNVTVEFEIIPQHPLSVNVAYVDANVVYPGWGSVTPAPGTHTFDEGTAVTLTAEPVPGYRVQGWIENGVNVPASWNVNTHTVTMNSANSVTVTFELNTSSIIDVWPNGTLSLQDAINQSANGDTIILHRGTYIGTGFVINKNITIQGEPDSPENVIIDCNNQQRYSLFGPEPLGFVLDSNATCTLNGISIINSHYLTYRSLMIVTPGVDGANTPDNYCGAIRIIGGNHTVMNCIIRDCSIDYISAIDGVAGDVNNLSGGDGGNGGNAGGAGIYVVAGNPVITKVLVENCIVSAGDAGDGNTAFFDPCNPPIGTAGDGGVGGNVTGAGIFIRSGNATFTNVIVRNCTATAGSGGNGADGIPIPNIVSNDGGDGGLPGRVDGAAIYCGSGAPVFANCSVENCIGYGGRGGNGGDGGPTNFNTTFGGYGGLTTVAAANQGDIRRFTASGGAVFCDVSSTAIFTDCNFIGNQVYGGISGLGGFTYLPAPQQQEPRRNYIIPGLGAGVFCDTASDVNFNNCRFEDNRAAYNQDFYQPDGNFPLYGEYTGSGGGLCLWNTLSTSISECDFSRNSAPLGGAIYGDLSGIYINKSSIAENSSMAGGGILTMDSPQTTIKKSVITGNSAATPDGEEDVLFGIGGGIYALSTLLDINDTIITDNYSEFTGGGICIEGDTPLTQQPYIKNCLITENTAVFDGGGIAVSLYAEPNIQNCTIAGNTVTDTTGSGGGLFASYLANILVKDSIFWGNSGIYGSQIALSNGYSSMPANLKITYSDIDLLSGVYTENGCTVTAANNIAEDPAFVFGYFLSHIATGQAFDSNCIDAGSATAAALGLDTYSTRYDGVVDTGTIDIGYHQTIQQYEITARVLDNPQGRISADPNTLISYDANTSTYKFRFFDGITPTLTAESGLVGYAVQGWFSDTNEILSNTSLFTFTVDSNQIYFVRFRQVNTIGVPGDYTYIRQAIDAAENGDTIILETGTYTETNLQVFDKDITITGSMPDNPEIVAQTIIDGTGQADGGLVLVGAGAGNCTLSGLTIANMGGNIVSGLDGDDPGEDGGDGGSGMGIGLIIAGNHKISNCIIRDCYLRGGNGGNGDNGDQDNRNGGDGGDGGDAQGVGMLIFYGSPVIKNCIVEDCCAIGGDGGDAGNGNQDEDAPGQGGRGGLSGRALGAGIWCNTGSNPVFENCIVRNCQATAGRGGDGGDSGENGPAGGYGGLYDGDPDRDSPTNYSAYGAGIYVEADCNAAFVNCTVTNNRTDGCISGLGGQSFYGVQQFPKTNLIYPSYGGGLYCAEDSYTKFEKCTIQNNQTTSHGNYYVGYGGGLAIIDGNHSQFTDCNIINNASTVGGGLYAINVQNLLMDGGDVVNNVSYVGGGLFTTHSKARISNCLINQNSAQWYASGDANDPNNALGEATVYGSGGGIYSFSTQAEIENCLISENLASGSGGGIYIAGSQPDLNCPLIKNCLITNNTSGFDGGGISTNWFATTKIQNCTITENYATTANGRGGGLFGSYASNTLVKDSIIWANNGINGSQIAVGSGDSNNPLPSTMDVSYTDVDLRLGVDFNSLELETGFDAGLETAGLLVDSQTIYNEISATGTARVIVSLVEPAQLRTATNWDSSASVSALQTEIGALQNQVLSTLDTSEFTIRHQLTNIAAFSGQITQSGLNKLLSNSMVAHIEPVKTVYPMLAQAVPLANALHTRTVYSGQGISIAIVDTGVDYTHPRLGNGNFPNSKVIGGYDTADGDANPLPGGSTENTAHGTCCAGIAAGLLGTVGDYIGGVAPDAKIYALKASPNASDGLPFDATLAAWDWCITHRNDNADNPIRIISNSWGLYNYPINNSAEADVLSPAHTIAARTAVEAGIAILASSGNDGFAGQGISWPSAMTNVISVGAIYDTTDLVTDYSNTAENLDILAPADPIYTTDIVGPAGYNAGDYFPSFNGTSSACPFAAGCVAALQSAAKQIKGNYLTPSQIDGILKITGDPVTDTKVAITRPRVNLGAAIALISESVPIYVEQGCTITGFQKDANDTWIIDDHNNIFDDPNFVFGYYLSNEDAGQTFTSPCFNAGSDTAINLGLNIYTSRTDGVNDSGIVNLGYHYNKAAPKYEVKVQILEDVNYPGIHGYVTSEPNRLESSTENTCIYRFYASETPTLNAIADTNYYVQGWYDKNNSLISNNEFITFTVDSSATYFVRFKPARVISVSGGDAALRNAVNIAANGDTLIVAAGIYTGGIDLDGKQIKLYGVNPDDPNVVAKTIIDCAAGGQGFIFSGGETADTIIDGFTIINGGGNAIQGGGIFIDANSSPLIVNVDINNCNVTNASGGAIYINQDSNPEFRNVNITNCGSTINGGAVYISQNSDPIFRDCLIADCNADINGGAVYCRTLNNPQFINCSFTGNRAANSAGAIFYETLCGITLQGCKFTENSAQDDAGAVLCDVGCSVEVNDCNFSGNQAQYAGGIYIDQDCDGAIAHTSFNGNAAEEDGGAVYIIDSNVIEISDSNIFENTALRGGGIFALESPKVTIKNCNINYNEAYRLVTYYTNPSDQNTIVEDDDFVAQGGGIYAFAAIKRIANCQIMNNMANTSGGGVYIAGEMEDANCPLIKNCLIIKNEAGRDGGGISSNWFATTKVTNCTIADNSANPAGFSMANGAGLYCSYGSVMDVNNSIIWGNVANDGSQIAVGGGDENYPLPGSARVTYSDIHEPNQTAAQALDVVICIDTTGSMGAVINSIKDAASDIVEKIAENTPDYRIAVVDYRDFPIPPYGYPEDGDYPYRDDSVFTSDTVAIQTAINAITLGVGGDLEESVYAALMHSIDGSSLGNWRSDNTKKIIILMGDIQPHDPEPTTGYRLEDVIAAANEKNINIFSILTGGGVDSPTATYYFENLAEDTDGTMFTTPDGSMAGDAVLQAIDLATRVAKPVYVEPNCVLAYWNSGTEEWDDVNSHNIHQDPNFVFGYYLSNQDAGQDIGDNNCFDAGLGTAAELGLDIYTSRADGVNDSGIVNLGYHYPQGVTRYQLAIDVNSTLADGTIEVPWDPNTYMVYENTMVRLHALPGINSRVAGWTVDGNPIVTHDRYMNVMMDKAHSITVIFEEYIAGNLIVPDEYASIQDAINAAESGDTIYVYRKDQPYYISDANGFDFKGKSLTIRSEDPNDPNIVAATIIDCNYMGRAFIFQNQEDANSIIEGFTIINSSTAGAIAQGVEPDPYDGNIFNGIDATDNGQGGAIYVGKYAKPIIRYCVFVNCEVTGGRGSDGQVGYSLYPDDERERGGEGGSGGIGNGNGYGGAIFCDQNSSPKIINCVISECAARGGIGGAGGNGGNGTDSKIGGDGGNGGAGSGLGYGGAIYVAQGATPKITGCSFIDNIAEMGLGGPGGLKGAGQIPDDPPFAYDGVDGQSIGTGLAGVIYYETGAKVDINDCNFINNTAQAGTDVFDVYNNGGGAIYCEPNCAEILINKTNITGNRAIGGSGGAIKFAAGNEISLTECYFGGNIADGNGGALMIGSEDAALCRLNIDNCAFTDNIAVNTGGAIMAKDFDANFVDCYINRNTANSGGGLYLISNRSAARIYGGTIMQNKAVGTNAEGGGAYVSNLPIDIINCQIMENTSLYVGGGIMLKGPDTTDSKIHNCLFVKNSANARGGAIIVSLDSSPSIKSCTFSENGCEPGGAGGAIFCVSNCSPIIKDCIFDQTKRIAIYENNADTDPVISYCLFYDNFDGDFYDYDSRLYKIYEANEPASELAAIDIVTGGHNQMGSKNFASPTPLFVEDLNDLGKYYLSQTPPNAAQSPAVNNGSAEANTVEVLPDNNMADYTTRTDNDSPDVNAGDTGQLDIGFHYIDIRPDWPRKYNLSTVVDGTQGTIAPPSGQYYAGTTVELTAMPEPGWRVAQWTGTDDDSATNNTNYVVMIGNKAVIVSFEQPQNIFVPGEYTTIQEAINDAKSGDKIVISKDTYQFYDTNYDYPAIRIWNKNITISSTNPDDPCVVAETIFLSSRFDIRDVDQTMVLEGITIQDAHYGGYTTLCPDNPMNPDGLNGNSILGGAMVITNASPTIRNCRFVNCSATGGNGSENCGTDGDGGWAGWARGGAVGIDSASNPVFKYCQFIDCFAAGGNGGDAGENGHGGNWGDPNELVNHSWDNAPPGGYEEYFFYSGYGGAVYCSAGSEPRFEKCIFSGNRSYGGVCGLSDPDYWEWPQRHYVIDSFGGAVYIQAGSQPKFTDCNFVNNEADTRGQIGDAAPVYNVEEWVLSDSVVSYGGAVCLEGAQIPVFKNCTFINNIACAGGAMYSEDSIAHISRCDFQNCTAMLGGAMLLADSNSIIFEADFSGNRAVEPAGQGGAVYCISSDAKFFDSRINGNWASASGGGLYFSGELEPNMHNCLITYNEAGRDGAGISANWDAQLNLSNCTITNNAVVESNFISGFGGGLSSAYEANVKIINSIIWDNIAEYGSEISIGSNFDAADMQKAQVTVSYSDIKDGAAGVFVDSEHGCILTWGDGNLEGTTLTNPLFVETAFERYYLSQSTPLEPGNVKSPAVDSGLDTAINNNMYRHTTRTDYVLDVADSNVDMGYHYTLTAEILGDFDFDGLVDLTDLDMFMDYWMNSGCMFPYFCHDRDMTEDGEVDFEDFAAFAENWNESEKTPPMPNPMTWSISPRSIGQGIITMTASPARDNSGSDVNYYFDCWSGGGNDRDWNTDSTYTDSGLINGNQYGYRVKARDGWGNETDWSFIGYAIAGEDDVPPDPDPMIWATAPYAISSSSIRMIAVTASDATLPVNYYFECVNDANKNSTWQTDNIYTAESLEPNTAYTFRVKARDSAPALNMTQFSEPNFAVTLEEGAEPNDANDPNAFVDTIKPVPNPSQWAIEPYAAQDVAPPYLWRHYMTAVTAVDANSPPVSYMFVCTSNSALSSGWQLSPSYISPGTYSNHETYKVYTKDAVGNTTDPSPELVTAY